ncbi:MAG: R3H domain-containing nucleic acid-binding protein [Anaerolineales bacterium]
MRPYVGRPSTQQGYRRQYNGVESEVARPQEAEITSTPASKESSRNGLPTLRIYPYGVARNRLSQAARRLGVPAVLVAEPSQADVLVTLRTYYRKRQHAIVDAERRNLPIHVLRANTVNQMQQFLSDLYNLEVDFGPNNGEMDYLRETQAAIEAVLNGQRWVELSPANASIRRLQHQMARQANLVSHSYGKEPNRRVRIFRDG